MAYQIEVHMPTMKDGVRAVRPGGKEAPYRFDNTSAAEGALRLISEPFNRDQYHIVEVK